MVAWACTPAATFLCARVGCVLAEVVKRRMHRGRMVPASGAQAGPPPRGHGVVRVVRP